MIEYKVTGTYNKREGISIWWWLLSILFFLPAVFLCMIAHYQTNSTPMVKYRYKQEGDWFWSNEQEVTLEEWFNMGGEI